MLLTVDRIENKTVIMIDDNGRVYDYDISLFTETPCEGDIFEFSEEHGTSIFTPAPEIAEERRNKIKSRFSRLLKKK